MSTVVEFDDGLSLAGLGQVADDGTYELVLPDGDSIPEALFRDAEDSVAALFFAEGPECVLESSAPTARATLTLFEGITIASPAFLAPEGIAVGLTTTEALDPEFDVETGFEDIALVSLAYATAPTTLTTTGADCAPEAGITVDVDVDLAAGWNQPTLDRSPYEGLTDRDRPVYAPLCSVAFPIGDL